MTGGMVGQEHGSEESGVSRRDMLKRGAVVGSAALWMSPALQIIGIGRHAAQAASAPPPPPPPPPPGGTGQGISFVAFRFTCNGTTFVAKLEGNTLSSCQGPNSGENCGVNQAGAASGCGLFTSTNTYTNGEPTRVVVTLTCPGGTFVEAMAKAGQGCFTATIAGNTATFQS